MAQVGLTVVHDQMEAEELCGLLRTNGIECWYRSTSAGAASGLGLGGGMGGPTEVLVDESDLEQAKELLPPEANVD